MTKNEAEEAQKRLAREHSEATWLIREDEAGDWAVVKVGLARADSSRVEETEERSRPPYPDDPLGSTSRNFSKWGAN